MKPGQNEKASLPSKEKGVSTRPRWLFEVDSYSRTNGESFSTLRDNLRLKKALRHALAQDFAPETLIESIRAGIRA